jgi:hypothetical protein
LREAGYEVTVQADFAAGNDFVHEMHLASQRARCTLALLSETYLDSSPMGEAEWRAAFAEDPSGEDRRLIPVRISSCQPPGLLRTRIYVDLVGLDAEAARRALLDGVGRTSAYPVVSPPFPGSPPAVSAPDGASQGVSPTSAGAPPGAAEHPWTWETRPRGAGRK